jgi:hypothetical protein
LRVMQDARAIGFKRLRTRDDFASAPLFGNYHLSDIRPHLERDERLLLFSFLQSPYLEREYEGEFVTTSIEAVDGDSEIGGEGLLCAALLDTVAISIASHERWSRATLKLHLLHDHKGPRECALPHASEVTHWRNHLRWASRRVCGTNQLTPTLDRPLRNTEYSNKCVSSWGDFYCECSGLQGGEKTAMLRECADLIAHINGFDHNPELSATNRKASGALRQVFSPMQGLAIRPVYLSTDFEKPAGVFEVFDHLGRHAGEWSFSGDKVSGADTSGAHDLTL